jgi:hypothetical protein
MQPGNLNLAIHQGATFRRSLTLRQTVTLLASASKGATQIKVQPFSVSVAAGTVWEFRWRDEIYTAVLAQPLAAATAGQTEAIAIVQPLPQFIPAMVRAGGPPVNLTGFTVRAMLRKSYKDAAPVVFDAAIVSPANQGRIELSLPAATTALLKPNCKDATQVSFEAKNLLFAPYVWDLEAIEASGEVWRVVNGLAVVTPEVTRA